MSAETIPDDIFQTACGIVMEAKSLKSVIKHRDVVDVIAKAIHDAVMAERERIVACLLEEAELTPCGEDAMVTRSNAFLIKADFSYEEAERLSEEAEG